jgi:hypothetical protein
MTVIGTKTVVYSTTLLLPDEESAIISFSVEDWEFKMLLSFHPEGGTEQSTQSSVEDDALRLRFNRWTNPLGTAYQLPIEIAKSPSGRSIAFLIYQHRIGAINRADLQFTVEG